MRPDLVLYAVVRAIVVGFCKLFWGMKIDGLEHVPADGPFVLSPVHRSNIDTLLVAAVTKRRMRYMGKDSMWKFKTPGRLFTALGAFPVHRGTADREALRTSVEVIKNGEPLVIFPEGTRQFGPEVQPLFEGAAYVASRTGVPVVPVGIGGSERAMPKGSKMIKPVRVHLVIGPPLTPEVGESGRASRRQVKELTERLHVELQRLFDEAQKKAGAS